jgi:hypothetical protein
MLTADLLRAKAKSGQITPSWVDAEAARHLERAKTLVETFTEHVGMRRAELDLALSAHIGDATDYKLQKGLIKLLSDRAEWRSLAHTDPVALRQRLFRLAVERGPVSTNAAAPGGTTRAALVAEVAQELGCTEAQLEESLYADLDQNQILESFEPLEPDELLHRYNTALAQSVLIKALELKIRLPGAEPKRWRSLLRAIKFFGLIHKIERTNTEYIVTLDGPLSLFKHATKYGVKMASFLPSLLRAPDWSLEATVQWQERERPLRFELSARDGLHAFGRDPGMWQSEEERWLVQRLAEREGPWEVDTEPPILELASGAVVVPDMALRHSDGRQVFVEIIWFWRRGSLEPRLKELRRAAPSNLFLCISDRLRASEDDIESPPVPCLRFKGELLPGKVLEMAEKIACHGAPTPSSASQRTKSTKEKPAKEKPAKEKPAKEKPAKEKPAKEKPAKAQAEG